MPLHKIRIVERAPDGQAWPVDYDESWGGHDLEIQLDDDYMARQGQEQFYGWLTTGEPFLVQLYNTIGVYLARKAVERAQAR